MTGRAIISITRNRLLHSAGTVVMSGGIVCFRLVRAYVSHSSRIVMINTLASDARTPACVNRSCIRAGGEGIRWRTCRSCAAAPLACGITLWPLEDGLHESKANRFTVGITRCVVVCPVLETTAAASIERVEWSS